MHYNPEDAVYLIRAQAHTSLIRTIHGRRTSNNKLVLAALLPVFIASTILLVDQYQNIPVEELHSTAPEIEEIVEGITPDESVEDQQQMMQEVCSTICWDDRIAANRDKLVLINFCTDVCGISYEEPTVMPELDTIIDEEVSIIPTVESIQDDAAIIESSLESVEESLRNIPHSQIGMYLTQNSMSNNAFLMQTVDDTKRVGGNALVFDVKGSYIYFESNSAMAKELGLVRPVYDLKKIVAMAREKGMYVIARYITVKDPSLASRIPDVQIKNKYTNKGIGDLWVTPNHPDVLSYNKSIIEEIVAAEVHEINFDYIRFPTEYNQEAIGLSGEQKADQLEEFLQMVRDIVEKNNSNVKIGISTYAILGWNFPLNFEPLGQDIARFSKLVDVISPMAYPSTFSPNAYYNPQVNQGSRNYYLVYRTLTGYQELLGKEAWKLRPWIQGYFMTSNGILDQINAVHDAGLCGFTVWNAENNYKKVYQAMADYEVPSHCS